MDEAGFDDLLADYLSGKVAPNLDMGDVEIVWIRGNSEIGSDHLAQHEVTEQEVEEVLLEVPPKVEARRHPDHPERTIFWGATRKGRWLFISCVDWQEGNKRHLKPITAFEPEEGVAYWSEQ